MQTAGKAVAIITARGGSKRIPHKNIKEFCGKPILAYSIEAALASGVFDRVMVSTDDEEIAEVARKYGAEVPFLRSEKTANDYATTKDVLEEVLAEYEKRGEHFDTLCCIYPTAPFITPDRLSEAMRLLEEKKGDTLLPVVRFSFPPQRCVVQDAEGYLKFKWPEYRNSRSQDLEPYYHDAGQFYCLRVSSFLAQQNLIMEKAVPMELPETEVQDIDNEEDWKLAEMKYHMLGKAFGPVVLCSLFWKRANKYGIVSGMIAGGAMIFIWKFGIAKLGGIFAVYELLPAFIFATLVIIVVSLATGKPSKEVMDKFEEVKNMSK